MIDSASDGHHIPYAKALAETVDEPILIVPEIFDGINCKQIIVDSSFANLGRIEKFPGYLKWLNEINKIIQSEHPDVIHFLFCDIFYFFMGIGMEKLCASRGSVATIHSAHAGKIRYLTRKLMAKKFSRVVVHTQALKNIMNNFGINNVTKIEYPALTNLFKISRDEALFRLGIKVPENSKVLLALGNTAEYKGLDILLFLCCGYCAKLCE